MQLTRRKKAPVRHASPFFFPFGRYWRCRLAERELPSLQSAPPNRKAAASPVSDSIWGEACASIRNVIACKFELLPSLSSRATIEFILGRERADLTID